MQFGNILGRPRTSSTSKALITSSPLNGIHRPRDITTLDPNKDNTSGYATSHARPLQATHARHTRRKRDSVKCAFFSLTVCHQRSPKIACDSGCIWVDKGHRSPATQICAPRHNGHQRGEELGGDEKRKVRERGRKREESSKI